MKSSSNLNISCKVAFSLNKWNKKVGSPSSFRRKRPFISLNSSASIESLSSSERARARARANHAKNDAQKGFFKSLSLFSKTIVRLYCSCKLEKKTFNIYKWKEKVGRRRKLQVTKAAFKGPQRFVFFTEKSLPCSETQPSK